MKKLTVWAMLALCSILALSCASSLPTQLPSTMKEACSLYQTVRPEVVKLRQYAKDNWPAIPPDVQATLLTLDGYLPALDRAGVAVCGISGVITTGEGGIRGASTDGIQWDHVLSTVVKAAALAVDLKTKGVI